MRPFAAAYLVVVVLSSHVVDLNDDNFEHLTQAGTGATTGDWFIKFFAPWCHHCQALVDRWDQTATELKSGVPAINVGRIDATANKKVQERFKAHVFPALILFRQGQLYRYPIENKRSVEELVDFARSGYAKVTPEPVPRPPTWLDKQLEFFWHDMEHILDIRKSAATVLVIGSFLAGVVCTLICTRLCCGRRRSTVEAGKKSQ
mmetsp:Transcript_29975/g.77052  ORF Transcript_29975/g.77052 Transcript_29975/m.77052 type:complete len:204 (+) Transcript_29975:28-639(+)